MTTPTTAELLKYADLQMAAEALLVQNEVTGQLKSNLKQALIEGFHDAALSSSVLAVSALRVCPWEEL